jgi:MFS transporter, Spinster family, sphingosine-1-phosphate transporter
MTIPSATSTNPAPLRWSHWGLAVLTAINLVNYIDRFLVPSMVESIKESELRPDDFQMGALATGFLIVYALAAPLFGVLGDRRSRPRWLAVGIFLWSIATVFSGLAWSYAALFASRALVGIGEAAYGTIAPSLLSDYYPRDRRGRTFAIFFCAIPVGAALGYVLGGLLDRQFGWRAAFMFGGIPGMLLAVAAWYLPDPGKGSRQDGQQIATGPQRRSVWKTYGGFLRHRPYMLTVLGYAAYTFAVGGLAFWMPSFLERERGIDRASATIGFGAIVVVTGLVGTFVGGWLGDYWARTSRQAYLRLCALSMLAAVPFAWIALTATAPPVFYSAIVVAQLLLFMSTGPVNSAIINFAAPHERASAMALSVFLIHFLGDVISPPLIGTVADHSSLGMAVLMVPAGVAVGGVIWWMAMNAAERAAQRADRAQPAGAST